MRPTFTSKDKSLLLSKKLDPITGSSYIVARGGSFVRVIAKRTLQEFWEIPEYKDAEQALKSWNAEAESAAWNNPHDIKKQFTHASIVNGERVVFNIAGNKYRLVVAIDWVRQIAFVKFIGTHKQYDKINVELV